MKLLNSKSILDCNEAEIEQHNKECSAILEILHKHDDYDCAVIYKYFDKSNKEKEPVIKQCNLYDCLDMVQFADIKNGVDFALVEGFLTFICYGSEYVLNNQVYLVTSGIQIRPYDKKKNYIFLNLH
mgnify:FL=1